MESNIRFESTQSEGEEGEIQNGDCRECQRAAKSRRVGNVNRSHRCLSSYSGGTEAQEIFSICVQRDSLPVQGATDGLDFITTGVHKGDKDNTAILTPKRSESPSVSRRLVDTWERLPAGERTHPDVGTVNSAIRLDNQPREIGIGAKDRLHIPRLSIHTTAGISMSNGRSLEEDSGENSSISQSDRDDSKEVDVISRDPSGNRENGEVGNAEDETHSNGTFECVESILWKPRRKNTSNTECTACNAVVVKQRQGDGRSSTQIVPSRTSSVYRCQSRWLGRSLGKPNHSGVVEANRKTISHKCAGVTSSVESARTLCRRPQRNLGTSSNRQFHDDKHLQAGRDKVAGNVRNHDKVLRVAGGSTDYNKVQAHSRPVECIGRSAIKSRTGDCNRMVHTSKNSGICVNEMGKANGGSICYKRQLQTEQLCVGHSRPECASGRCSVNKLGQHDSVCFSSDSDIGKSTGETANTRLQDDSHSTSMAETEMVPGVIGIDDRLSTATTKVATVVETAQIGDISSAPRNIPPTRLEIIEQGKRARGFSAKVVEVVIM